MEVLVLGALGLGGYLAEWGEYRQKLDALPGLQYRYIEEGLMAEDECKRYFNHVHLIEYDIGIMDARRMRTTAKTPAFSDIERLPPREVTMKHWMLARRFMRYLEEQRPWLGPAQQDELDRLINHQQWTIAVWERLDDAHMEGIQRGRRIIMGELVELIGQKKWVDMDWPQPIPPAAFHDTSWLEK